MLIFTSSPFPFCFSGICPGWVLTLTLSLASAVASLCPASHDRHTSTLPFLNCAPGLGEGCQLNQHANGSVSGSVQLPIGCPAVSGFRWLCFPATDRGGVYKNTRECCWESGRLIWKVLPVMVGLGYRETLLLSLLSWSLTLCFLGLLIIVHEVLWSAASWFCDI